MVDGGPNYGGMAVTVENAGAINGKFVLVDLSACALQSGDVLETKSDEAGVTQFARPEDGHWTWGDPRSFYFAATGTSSQSARLYKLHFDGKTWKVRAGNPGAAVQVLRSSPDFFSSGSPTFHTAVEESTGVIDVTSIVRVAPWFQTGRRYYLANLMDHLSSPDSEIIQGGQLYLFSGP